MALIAVTVAAVVVVVAAAVAAAAAVVAVVVAVVVLRRHPGVGPGRSTSAPPSRYALIQNTNTHGHAARSRLNCLSDTYGGVHGDNIETRIIIQQQCQNAKGAAANQSRNNSLAAT